MLAAIKCLMTHRERGMLASDLGIFAMQEPQSDTSQEQSQ
jgi:hypothetical protein